MVELVKKSLIKKFFRIFPAFRHRNYQYYFSGQLISFIGTWLQTVAQGWLVLKLTNSAFMVGVVNALGFLPVLLFGLLGGAIVDRFYKKRILVFTQIAPLILAIALGSLAIFGLANVWIVAVFAFLLGIINAIDMPARQTFTAEIVSSEHLPSAIALNMGSFNTAQVIGPAIAGIMIAAIGSGGAFIVNGLSFLAPLFALMLMNVKSDKPKIQHDTLRSIKIGIHYVFRHKQVRTLMITAAISSIFGFSYTTILPVVVQNVFHRDATTLGIFFSVAGTGAILSTFFVSMYYKRFAPEQLIFGGGGVFGISILLLSFTSNFYFALVPLFMAGFGLAVQMATINSVLQDAVEHHLRGRVMSIFTLSFVGMLPFGSFQIGFVSEHFGPQIAIGLGGIIIIISSIYLYLTLPKGIVLSSQKQQA